MNLDRDDILLKKYDHIIKLYIETVNMYWKSYSVFMVMTGLLLAGYAQIITYGPYITSVYCIFGIIIAVLWRRVTRRSLVYAEIAEDIGRNIEKDLFNRSEIKERIGKFKGKSKVEYKDWYREKMLRGFGFFQATQRILHHEMHNNTRNKWINYRYSKDEIKLITKKKAIPIMTTQIPIYIIVMWILLLIGAWLIKIVPILNISLP